MAKSLPPLSARHEDFLDEMSKYDLSLTFSRWMMERIPHAFSKFSDKYLDWKHELGQRIGIDPRAIAIIGSATIGFSLNPNKNYKKFDAKSDVDVAAISEYHFDVAWNWIRELGSERHGFPNKVRSSLTYHREELIFSGAIATDRILQYLPFAKPWVEALSYASAMPPVDGREVNIRIYKDFKALRDYQLENLRLLHDKHVSDKS